MIKNINGRFQEILKVQKYSAQEEFSQWHSRFFSGWWRGSLFNFNSGLILFLLGCWESAFLFVLENHLVDIQGLMIIRHFNLFSENKHGKKFKHLKVEVLCMWWKCKNNKICVVIKKLTIKFAQTKITWSKTKNKSVNTDLFLTGLFMDSAHSPHC